MKRMTELHVRNPGTGVVQVVPVDAIKEKIRRDQEEMMRRQRQQGPAFMQEKYMQDQKFILSLKEIALRDWKPPSATRSSTETEEKSRNGPDELDFSDLKVD